MRYADGPTAEVSISITAPIERVWALISDIAIPARFSTELQRTEWLGGDGPRLGARFAGWNRHGAIGEWDTVSTVTGYEPPHLFEWTVGDLDDPTAAWRFVLDPGPSGEVILTQWCRIGPGRSGLSAAIEAMPDKEERIVERRMSEHATNMTANLEGIKQLAEGEAG